MPYNPQDTGYGTGNYAAGRTPVYLQTPHGFGYWMTPAAPTTPAPATPGTGFVSDPVILGGGGSLNWAGAPVQTPGYAPSIMNPPSEAWFTNYMFTHFGAASVTAFEARPGSAGVVTGFAPTPVSYGPSPPPDNTPPYAPGGTPPPYTAASYPGAGAASIYNPATTPPVFRQRYRPRPHRGPPRRRRSRQRSHRRRPRADADRRDLSDLADDAAGGDNAARASRRYGADFAGNTSRDRFSRSTRARRHLSGPNRRLARGLNRC